MLQSIKTTIIFSVMITALAAATIGYLLYEARSSDEGVHVIRNQVIESHAIYPSWVTDDEFLVGASDNVFVGRVSKAEDIVSTSGPGEAAPLPESQFNVEVNQNIKGTVTGTATVVQDSGWIEYHANKDYPNLKVKKGEKVRQLVLTEKNPLLEPGEQYLFVTNHDQNSDRYYTLASRLGTLKIKDDGQRDKLTKHFKEAKSKQKDPDMLFDK